MDDTADRTTCLIFAFKLSSFHSHALGDWIEVTYSASDSTIAISWSIYEKAKLLVFQRIRVSNIRQKLNLENLFHIDGKSNLADFGTRPDAVTADLLKPGSEWLNGKSWMTLPVEEAQENGTFKSTKDITINNEMIKVLREGTFFDDFDQLNYTFNHFDAKKSAQIEAECLDLA